MMEPDDGTKPSGNMTDCFGRQSSNLPRKVDYKKCWQLAPEYTVHFMCLEFQKNVSH